MKINHNMSATIANKRLLASDRSLSASVERLSTGLKINRASDDAAGMASIASIPSREVLISRLLGSLQSPITNFARVMNQLAEKGGASACGAPEAAAAE